MPSVKISEHLVTPDIVKAEREKIGLTEAELAAKANRTQSEIADFEAGKVNDIRVAAAIGQALNRLGVIFPKA